MNKNKNTRLRFTYEDDLALLKEFLNVNPTINPQGWETIQQHLLIITGKNFLIRTLKQHIILLIETWLKKVQVDEIRSGVEEPQCERNALLQEVYDICRDNNYCLKEKKRPLSKEQQICNIGKRARENFAIASFHENLDSTELKATDSWTNSTVASEDTPVRDVSNDHAYVVEDILCEDDVVIEHNNYKENISEPSISPKPSTSTRPTASAQTSTTSQANETPNKINNNVIGPSRKRINRREPLRKNALAYLSDKNEKENRIRIMELELEQRKVAIAERRVQIEERRLQLDEKRLDLEYKERMEKLEIEKSKAELDLEQKKIINQLLVSQQQQIDNLRRETYKN